MRILWIGALLIVLGITMTTAVTNRAPENLSATAGAPADASGDRSLMEARFTPVNR